MQEIGFSLAFCMMTPQSDVSEIHLAAKNTYWDRTCMTPHPCITVQSPFKRPFPRFGEFCSGCCLLLLLNLPAAFSQPWNGLLEEPCTYVDLLNDPPNTVFMNEHTRPLMFFFHSLILCVQGPRKRLVRGCVKFINGPS